MNIVFNKELLKTCGDKVFVSGNVEIKHPGLAEIGSNVAIDSGFYCTTQLKLGDYVHIGPYCTVIGGKSVSFQMGHCSGLAAGCRIICTTDECLGEGLTNPMIPDEYRDKLTSAPVVVEDFVTVGTNAVIFPGVTLGKGCVIGANSLVRENTVPWGIYVGSPARILKMRRSDKILEIAKKMGYDWSWAR